MLYDPKWEVETKKPSMIGLIAWLEKQPPEERYNYDDCQGACLLGQYLNAIGLRWEKNDGPGQEIWASKLWISPMGRLSAARPHTFGGALERAREKLASGEI